MDESQKKAPKATLVRRMLEEACDRISDAGILRQSMNFSNSAYLLIILGFEILLKAVHLAHVGDPPREHKYLKLFCCLPDGIRSDIKTKYENIRREIRLNYKDSREVTTNPDLTSLLETVGEQFVELRYEYELTESKSDEELHKAGLAWYAKGAPLPEADIVYYQLELEGLCDELKQLLGTWLEEQPETP